MRRLIEQVLESTKIHMAAVWVVVIGNAVFFAELSGALIALVFTIIVGIWSIRAKKRQLKVAELRIEREELEIQRLRSDEQT